VKISVAVAAAAALVATLTPVASSGRAIHAAPASTCSGGVWPGTARGTPDALASSGSYAVYTWVGRGVWHVRVKGSPSLPLTGQVSANTQVRVVGSTASMRLTLDRTGKRLTFGVTGTRAVESLDVIASCASRVHFAFGSSSSSAALQPRIYLGTRGQAPTPAFDLARPATTGVAGRILVGPTCPVAGFPGCPPAKAMQGTVRIEQAPTSRGGGSPGSVVARVPSDANGNFSASLAPGHYMLVVEASSDNFPRPRPSLVDVHTGVISDVVLVLDTGIR
jgi:hypothetical protein